MKKIVSVILALSMLFAFTGCGTQDSPSSTMERFLTAVKNNDENTINEYMDYNSFIRKDMFDQKENGDLYYSLLGRATENLEFSIIDENIEDNVATLTIKVRNINMADVIPDAISSVLANKTTPSRDDVQAALDNYMNIASGKTTASVDISKSVSADGESNSLPTEALDSSKYEYETEIEIVLRKTDEGWEVKNSKNLFDKLTGNYISAVSSLADIGISK